MNNIFIIFLLFFIQTITYSQDIQDVVVCAVINEVDTVSIQDVLIRYDEQLVFTNHLGECQLQNVQDSIHVFIDHIGYHKVDSIFIKKSAIEMIYLLPDENCVLGREQANMDIKTGNVRILLFGGIVPKEFVHQKKIEDKYAFSYDDYGCTPERLECMKLYNFQVFQHLEQTFGSAWRNEVRKDALGLKEFTLRNPSK